MTCDLTQWHKHVFSMVTSLFETSSELGTHFVFDNMVYGEDNNLIWGLVLA